MKFVYEKESSKIVFNFRERLTLLLTGKLEFTDVEMKKLFNNLFKICVDFQLRFDKNVQNLTNDPEEEINTK
jgi:hypothetical protein